jgi:inorganic pyrophosphatase
MSNFEPSNIKIRSHPWHGLSLGDDAPKIVNCFIEIVPSDTVKYELDKETGILMIDRPQQYSSMCPTLYGLLPRTYAGPLVADYCSQKTGMKNIVGDGDPMDICVLTEYHLPRGDIFLKARPIGGLRLLDGNEADDKIIAVLIGDILYENVEDINDCPEHILERLRHYFLTYKDSPETKEKKVQITHTYGVEEAYEIINLSRQDYENKFK